MYFHKYKCREEQPAEWVSKQQKVLRRADANNDMVIRLWFTEKFLSARTGRLSVFVYIYAAGAAEEKTARWSHLFVHAYFLSFWLCPRLPAPRSQRERETSSLKMIFVRNKIIIKSDQGKRSLFTPRRWAWAEKMTRTWPVWRRSLISHARPLRE